MLLDQATAKIGVDKVLFSTSNSLAKRIVGHPLAALSPCECLQFIDARINPSYSIYNSMSGISQVR